MNIHDAYIRLQLEINKNASRANIAIEPGEFALKYNIEKDQYVLWKLKNKNSTYINDLEELLKLDINLELAQSGENYNRYRLPADFLREAASYVIASKGPCSGIALYIDIAHPKEKDILSLFNKLSIPSFEYQETNGLIAENHLIVNFSDFQITETRFSYYRKIKAIAFKGVEQPDGTIPTQDVHPDDLDDIWVNEIINRVAQNIRGAYEDQLGYQLSKDKVVNEP